MHFLYSSQAFPVIFNGDPELVGVTVCAGTEHLVLEV
jgi:hypothetical protein